MTAFSVANENGIAVLTFDLPGEPVNKLNGAVKAEFEALMGQLGEDGTVRAVVLISGKPDIFIAGADIEEFTELATQAEAEALSREGQEMVDRVDRFPKPVIAAIHGACLGGGLELALACDYRLATEHPKTQLGLPEVQLGLLPGAGGCQRLPRLIGASAALGMILPENQSGRPRPSAWGWWTSWFTRRCSASWPSRQPSARRRGESPIAAVRAGSRPGSWTAIRSAANWCTPAPANRCSRPPTATTRRRWLPSKW